MTTNRGLYELRLLNNGGAYVRRPRLLVPDVQDMVITYGLDRDGDPLKSTDILLAASNEGEATENVDDYNIDNIENKSETETTPWARVARINLRMLLFSQEVGSGNKPNRPFLDIHEKDVANPPDGPNDRRYRRTFNTVINLRIATPEEENDTDE